MVESYSSHSERDEKLMKRSVGKPEERDERTGRKWDDNIKVDHYAFIGTSLMQIV